MMRGRQDLEGHRRNRISVIRRPARGSSARPWLDRRSEWKRRDRRSRRRHPESASVRAAGSAHSRRQDARKPWQGEPALDSLSVYLPLSLSSFVFLSFRPSRRRAGFAAEKSARRASTAASLACNDTVVVASFAAGTISLLPLERGEAGGDDRTGGRRKRREERGWKGRGGIRGREGIKSRWRAGRIVLLGGSLDTDVGSSTSAIRSKSAQEREGRIAPGINGEREHGAVRAYARTVRRAAGACRTQRDVSAPSVHALADPHGKLVGMYRVARHR